jgi:hypothetical protein
MRQRRPYMAVKPTRKPKADEKPNSRQRGRPEIFSQELADQILDRMACGETLTQICADQGMPHRATVRRWVARNEFFSQAYTRARELLADVYAEQAITIADDSSDDIATVNGKSQSNWENVQRSRLRCDMRRWFAAKLAPRRYSDKLVQEHTGPNEGPIEINRTPMLPHDVAMSVAELLSAAEREMGLPISEGKPEAERMSAIRGKVNGAYPPSLYEAVHLTRKPNDDRIH